MFDEYIPFNALVKNDVRSRMYFRDNHTTTKIKLSYLQNYFSKKLQLNFNKLSRTKENDKRRTQAT